MRSDNTGRYIAEYVWEGGRLIREINPDRTITFLYDGDEVAGFSAGGSNYYYAKDSFGVISYVYNEDGSLYASYKYDAWGSLITSASTLPASGDINPIRYKSYYYDADTGFYYLQSRYYDPFVGRFLNADDAAYLGISGTVLGWNMFAYCENDSIRNNDSDGTVSSPIQWLYSLVGGISGYVFGDFIARSLGFAPWGRGLWNSSQYWIIRSGIALGGISLGWLSGTLKKELLKQFLVLNIPVFYLILRKITTLVVRFSVVYEVIKDVAYASGSILLNRLNCPISKEMYRHSFYGRGKRYSSKSLNEKIRDDLQFRQEILNKLDGLSSIIDPITVTINKWKDRDLAYSIGQINFIITGRRIGDIWSLTIKASDLYDFTEWRVLSGGFTLGDFANDFGHILSDFGMINKYRYYVDFQLTLTI